ncbi:MAG: TonB family protein [Casimicrobiaceae bacterium]
MPRASRTPVVDAPPPAAKKRPARPRATVVKTTPARPRATVVKTTAVPLAMSLPFLDVDAAPGHRLLANAIGWSVLLHMVVLAIHFSPVKVPSFDRNGPPLEIALVNAKSESRPTKADILAQANLDGGGNTDANRRAKTPLPAPLKDSATQDLSLATQQVAALEQRSRELMTELKSTPVVAPPSPAPKDGADVPPLPNANEMMQRTLETIRLEAQIAKQMDAYQKRPKRRFVGARAEEYRFARYVEDWRLKVEGIGNRNYPAAARDQKLYGSLLLTVGIRANGVLDSVVIDRSSGQKVLDLAAQKIVEMAAPYAAFPSDIKRDTDILYITRTWTFAPGDSLTSQ